MIYGSKGNPSLRNWENEKTKANKCERDRGRGTYRRKPLQEMTERALLLEPSLDEDLNPFLCVILRKSLQLCRMEGRGGPRCLLCARHCAVYSLWVTVTLASQYIVMLKSTLLNVRDHAQYIVGTE